jgi:hypothetical protein
MADKREQLTPEQEKAQQWANEMLNKWLDTIKAPYAEGAENPSPVLRITPIFFVGHFVKGGKHIIDMVRDALQAAGGKVKIDKDDRGTQAVHNILVSKIKDFANKHAGPKGVSKQDRDNALNAAIEALGASDSDEANRNIVWMISHLVDTYLTSPEHRELMDKTLPIVKILNVKTGEPHWVQPPEKAKWAGTKRPAARNQELQAPDLGIGYGSFWDRADINDDEFGKWATWYSDALILPNRERDSLLEQLFGPYHHMLHFTNADAKNGNIAKFVDMMTHVVQPEHTKDKYAGGYSDYRVNSSWDRAWFLGKHKPYMPLKAAIIAATSPMTELSANVLNAVGIMLGLDLSNHHDVFARDSVPHGGSPLMPIPIDVLSPNNVIEGRSTAEDKGILPYNQNVSFARLNGLIMMAKMYAAGGKTREMLPTPIQDAFDYVVGQLREAETRNKRRDDQQQNKSQTPDSASKDTEYDPSKSPLQLVAGVLVGVLPIQHFRAFDYTLKYIIDAMRGKASEQKFDTKAKDLVIDWTDIEKKLLGYTKRENGVEKRVSGDLNRRSEHESDLSRHDTMPKGLQHLADIFKHNDVEHVTGSMLLGPKIGAFASNFLGNMVTPTLDTWAHRMFFQPQWTPMQPDKQQPGIWGKYVESYKRVERIASEKYIENMVSQVLDALNVVVPKNQIERTAGKLEGKLRAAFEKAAKNAATAVYGDNLSDAEKLRRGAHLVSNPTSLQAILWSFVRNTYYVPEAESSHMVDTYRNALRILSSYHHARKAAEKKLQELATQSSKQLPKPGDLLKQYVTEKADNIRQTYPQSHKASLPIHFVSYNHNTSARQTSVAHLRSNIDLDTHFRLGEQFTIHQPLDLHNLTGQKPTPAPQGVPEGRIKAKSTQTPIGV